MVGPRRLLDEQKIHLVFELSLWLKGVFALSEIIAGVAAYFISQQFSARHRAMGYQGRIC